MKSSDDLSPLFVDSDNALGSPFGDIDDAFAVAAILKSCQPIEALTSVFGNSFEPLVYRNHRALAGLCNFNGKILRGAATWWSGQTDASNYLADLNQPIRVLALGPMTNLALALRKNGALAKHVTEVIYVGTNYSIPLPAFRFFDFNQWKDPRATREIFQSGIPLTIIPCDVARRLRVTETQVESIPGALGEHFRRHSRRWFRRSKMLKGLDSVPVWDLVPAIYALYPSLFETITTTAELGRMGQAVFGLVGGRPIRVVTDFEASAVWKKFISLVSKEATGG